jgi:uncharacterized protein (TIGR00730 family)
MKRIGVYLGARPGNDAAYKTAVELLGRAIVERGFGLVYGGSAVGLMGALADSVLDAGGNVFGVIPHSLTEREKPHPRIQEAVTCHTMAERKCLMEYLSCGFISAPGGFGTLDETFDILTLRQIGRHNKPFGLLNVNSFYDPLLTFLDSATRAGFVRHEHRNLVHVDPAPGVLIDRMFGTWANPLSRA